MVKGIALLLLGAMFVAVAFSASTKDWKERAIYQVLTDRIERTNGDNTPCDNLSDYCGGTYQGLMNELDYIQNMGFDAIWISPIVTNTPNGYHGYWAQDIYTLNPYFGTESDFVNFVAECHKRDIYVMVDVVANHMGPVGFNYTTLTPFNTQSSYHDCYDYCTNCDIQNYACLRNEIYNCRTAGLPDLNQSNQTVKNTLINWISGLVQKYNVDGLRIDTILEVEADFWGDFCNAAGVYSVGETFSGDVNCLAAYTNDVPGLLSYPMYYSLKNAFMGGDNGQSLVQVNYTQNLYTQQISDPYAMGTFIDNHDNPRWLHLDSDYVYYKSALTYVVYGIGIPIIYYGTEQGYAGGNDPNNREPLWTSNFNQNAELYEFLKLIVSFRQQQNLGPTEYIQRYLLDNFLCWTRGDIMVAVTNQKKNIHYDVCFNPYSPGQKLCNLFYPNDDCVDVDSKGCVPVYLNGGEQKIYYPVDN
mmetsp:Transcript_21694/g.33722  ORF Transcript_21694/g.33722 Transcript_21694/m.33722 type:complete len:472 (-) Transcript_21694:75-1490(-)|eukprot:CAMPEP_0201512572 /NCGR_PEP_ID=MMETSP0161_2-20130828/4789_1 /ASSEMBLY_ACC=CAM_ASM_000251 /TAXON_ID=180227 /ORGANISM="Neoparamoeba aestuarina, Strain SoJaBio B1-5/56/2" /LENGTH=471 /DNA_ID=CAMNT_0047908459 /DNA_START=24 /DNA_END=1439 /DNA_ORIENTATION=-